MKIDQKVIALKSASAPETPAGAKTIAAPAASSAASGASVATHLPVASGGEFDAERVAQIREAIAAGRYPIDTSRIADGLLGGVRAFLNKRP